VFLRGHAKRISGELAPSSHSGQTGSVERGEMKMLIIEMPPRAERASGSIFFPAWYLGRHPREKSSCLVWRGFSDKIRSETRDCISDEHTEQYSRCMAPTGQQSKNNGIQTIRVDVSSVSDRLTEGSKLLNW